MAHGQAETLAHRDRRDPTRSRTLRRRYARRLRGELADLNATIREAVQSGDLFGLRAETLATPPNARRYRFATDDEKIERFMAWLRREERRGILETIQRGENEFIRSAYGKGVRHADDALQAEGITVPDERLADIFNQGVHRDTLQQLYTRNFQELQGITNAMDQQISRELADGFARGVSPTQMARNITDRVDSVGKHRATVLARTEVIRAHSQSSLRRFEQLGVDEVSGKAEFSTAGDSRVCPRCLALEGRTFTLEEASGIIPVHPQCRCVWVPVVS